MNAPLGRAISGVLGRYGGLLLLAFLLIALYAPSFLWMWDRWWAEDSYYSHGLLVPLVVAYLVWRLRQRLAGLPVRPSRWGLPVIAMSLLAELLSAAARIDSAAAFTLLPLLMGLVLFLAGSPALRLLAVPILFLAFMIPLPLQLIADLNLELKLMATKAAEVVLDRVFGLVVVRDGSKMFFRGGSVLAVEDVCSGLRSLVSLVAFAALYAYLSRLSRPRQLLLLAAAGPLAIAANVVRIAGLGLVADAYGSEAAGGWVHDLSGYLVFVVALGLMFVLESLLALVPARRRAAPPGRESAEEPPPAGRPLSNRRAVALALALLPVVLLTWWLAAASPALQAGDVARRAVPYLLGPDGQWASQEEITFSRRTLQILETDDYLCRVYVHAQDGSTVELVIVFSRDNRKGTHPPEVCLKGEGYSIQDKRAVAIPLADRAIPMTCLRAESAGEGRLYLYTYKCGDTFTPHFLKQQLMLLANALLRRPTAGALIRLSTPVLHADDGAALDRLIAFAQAVMPHIVEKLDARPAAHPAAPRP